MARSCAAALLIAFGLAVGGCTGTGAGGVPGAAPASDGAAASSATVSAATSAATAGPPTDGSEAASASASTSATTVAIYLLERTSEDCQATRAVERAVASRSPGAALRALLAGPTAAEIAEAYSSWFSAATADMLEGMSVAGGVARISFRDLRPVIPNASSSCGSAALLSALDATLRQFPEVRATRYSILGDEAAFYEWLQRGVPAG